MPVPTYTQSRYRFRDGADTGAVDATPTWLAAENTGVTVDVTDGNVKIRLRIGVQETNGRSAAATSIIRSSIDGFAAALTTTSSGVRAADCSTDADNTALVTRRLTAGTGTFYNGQYDESGTTGSVTNVSSGHSEFEFGLELVRGNLTDAQVVTFRIYTNAVLPTITQTPTITITKAPGADIGALTGALIGSPYF